MDEILKIKNLEVYFGNTKGVECVSFTVKSGEILALVGESGSGKSVTAQAILRLNSSAKTKADTLTLAGQDVLTLSEKEMDNLRGGVVGMVFQDPMTCLNPTMKIGKQITERLYRKEGLSPLECKKEAVRLLKQVRISDPELRAEQYPHQLSGGMRQRVMIAMALACKPRLLIADEPTTALDVTTQLQILRLLAQIRKETGAAVLLITHDLGVVANLADRVAVMHSGKIVEIGSVSSVFKEAYHPYTKELMEDLASANSDIATDFGGYSPKTTEGCAYFKKCTHCMNICLKETPPMKEVAQEHFVGCWHYYNSPQEGSRHG